MSRSPIGNPLSYEGVKRRDQILRLAKITAQARKRRRHISRTVLVNFVFLLIATITALVAMRVPRSPRNAVVQRPPEAPLPIIKASPAADEVQIGYIVTDPTIADRLAIKPDTRGWESIDDDELFRVLANAGKQAGIVEIDGRVELMVR